MENNAYLCGIPTTYFDPEIVKVFKPITRVRLVIDN